MGPPSPRGEGGPFACAIWGRVQNYTSPCHVQSGDGCKITHRCAAPHRVAGPWHVGCREGCRLCARARKGSTAGKTSANRKVLSSCATDHDPQWATRSRSASTTALQASKQRASLSNNVKTLRNILENRKRPGAWSVDRPDTRAYHSELRVLWTDADVP